MGKHPVGQYLNNVMPYQIAHIVSYTKACLVLSNYRDWNSDPYGCDWSQREPAEFADELLDTQVT